MQNQYLEKDYLPLDSHTDTVISDRFAYVPDKMALETVIRPIGRLIFVISPIVTYNIEVICKI